MTDQVRAHQDGQNADVASHDRATRQLLADLADAGNTIDAAQAALNRAGYTDPAASVADLIVQLAAERDSAQQVATFRQGVIDQYAAEIGLLGEVIAELRDTHERADRALARLDTQPEVTPVEADEPDATDEPEDLRSPLAAERDKLVDTIGRLVSLPPEQIAQIHKVGYSGSGSPQGRMAAPTQPSFNFDGRYVSPMVHRSAAPTALSAGQLGDASIRANVEQVEAIRHHARGYADAVALLRDDERYRNWWSSGEVKPDGPIRKHLADYLEVVGPDGENVTAAASEASFDCPMAKHRRAGCSQAEG